MKRGLAFAALFKRTRRIGLGQTPSGRRARPDRPTRAFDNDRLAILGRISSRGDADGFLGRLIDRASMRWRRAADPSCRRRARRGRAFVRRGDVVAGLLCGPAAQPEPAFRDVSAYCALLRREVCVRRRGAVILPRIIAAAGEDCSRRGAGDPFPRAAALGGVDCYGLSVGRFLTHLCLLKIIRRLVEYWRKLSDPPRAATLTASGQFRASIASNRFFAEDAEIMRFILAGRGDLRTRAHAHHLALRFIGVGAMRRPARR